jgi:hypothetical protein
MFPEKPPHLIPTNFRTAPRGIDGIWKWLFSDLVGHTKSGKAENHAAGVKAAQRAIDRALAPKKKRLVPPGR